jgi:hypothetical protein
MKVSKYKQDSLYVCECGRTFEKSQSLNAHFSHCIIHRNGVLPTKRNHGGGWNKGLTADTCESVLKYTVSKKGKSGRKWTEEEKKNHSILMKGRSGGYREGSNKWKGIRVLNKGKEVWLDSSYELRFVTVLNNLGIDWEKNYRRFPYTYNDDKKNYIPDFYLHELDLWTETKGMLKDTDKHKWEQFPHDLKVLFHKELTEVECIKTKQEMETYLNTGLVLKLVDKQD